MCSGVSEGEGERRRVSEEGKKKNNKKKGFEGEMKWVVEMG